jgi:dGTP triphosphohydrolase
MHNKSKQPSQDAMTEVYQDLNSLAEAKNSVNELLNYRKSILDKKVVDANKIAEFKQRALLAIDELFEEYAAKEKTVKINR